MNTQTTRTNIVSVERVVELVLARFSEQMGAGQIAKATNAALEILGVETTKDGEVVLYQVTQQMMTNYGKSGAFDGQKYDSMAGVTFAQSVIASWLTRFLNKRVNGIVVNSSRGIKSADIAAQIKAELGMTKTIEEPADDDEQTNETTQVDEDSTAADEEVE